MLHNKRRSSPLLISALLLGIVLIAGAVLMMKDIPAPQVPVEKELDASAFLATRQ